MCIRDRVEIVFCGREIASQFQTKLNDKEADDFPDIIIQNTGVLAPLAQEGLFEPLDEALTTPVSYTHLFKTEKESFCY